MRKVSVRGALSKPVAPEMFTKIVFFFVATYLFKLFAEVLFNYEIYFDQQLPKHVNYDFIVGEISESF